jgi:hypothetical protein
LLRQQALYNIHDTTSFCYMSQVTLRWNFLSMVFCLVAFIPNTAQPHTV